MDNAQKAIMIGVGLFIAIIIISAVLLIANMGTGLINKGTGEAAAIGSQLSNELVDKYQGSSFSGIEVLEIAKQNHMNTQVSFVIENRTPAGSYEISYFGAKRMGLNTVYPITSSTRTQGDQTFDNISRTALGLLSANDSRAYINPQNVYNSFVIRNDTSNAVIGIAFTQQ